MRLLTHALAASAGAALAALIFVRFPPTPSTPPPAPRTIAAPASSSDASSVLAAATEIARLRAENTRLAAELAAARSGLATTSETLAVTARDLAEFRRPLDVDMVSSTLRATLRPGEAIVTGGHRLPDGRRLFTFVQPSENPDGTLSFVTRLASLPEEAVREHRLDNLLTEAANTLQHGEVWLGDEFADLAHRLATRPDVAWSSTPDVTTQPGRRAEIGLTNPDGEQLNLRLDSTRAPDGTGLDVELRFETLPAPDTSPETPPTATPAPVDAAPL